MIHRKRIQERVRTLLAALMAVALGACSAGTDPAPTAQTRDPPTRQSDAGDSASMLPEVVVSARRLSPPRVAAETLSRPTAKRRGG
jgi:hypothetical protein